VIDDQTGEEKNKRLSLHMGLPGERIYNDSCTQNL